MSVQIIFDEENNNACLYCNTTDWAFGPVYCGKDGREFMNGFIQWLPKDSRRYLDAQLQSKYLKFHMMWNGDEEPDEKFNEVVKGGKS